MNTPTRDAGARPLVLDSLRLIEHHHVESHISLKEVRVRSNLFVSTDQDGNRKMIERFTILRISLDDANESVGGPNTEFMAPISAKRPGGDDQGTMALIHLPQNPDGQNGLDCLPEPHLICEQSGFTLREKGYSLTLIRT